MSFEPLNSSPPLSAPSYPHAKPQAIWLFWHENPQKQPNAKVLKAVMLNYEVYSYTILYLQKSY